MEQAEFVPAAPVSARHRAPKVEAPKPAEAKRERPSQPVEEGFDDVVHNWPCTD